MKEIIYKNNLFSIITEFAIWSVTWKISADRYLRYKLTTLVSCTIKLILETVLSKNEEITIAGDVYQKNLVKGKFLKPNYSHVEYVINCLGKNTNKVRNIKSYLLASLFNTGSIISNCYRSEVNYDIPQFAG